MKLKKKKSFGFGQTARIDISRFSLQMHQSPFSQETDHLHVNQNGNFVFTITVLQIKFSELSAL